LVERFLNLGYLLALGIDMPKKEFNKLLLEAIDEGLSSLGDGSKQAIYFHLEKGFKVKKHEIPYKVEDFAGAVEKIFGLGASFLEILIMKRLYEKIGEVLEWHEPAAFTFTGYVAKAERSFLRRRKPKR
jgi:hypothetical protein